jgi:hypothetical protein
VQRVQQKYDRHGLNEENGIIVDLVLKHTACVAPAWQVAASHLSTMLPFLWRLLRFLEPLLATSPELDLRRRSCVTAANDNNQALRHYVP